MLFCVLASIFPSFLISRVSSNFDFLHISATHQRNGANSHSVLSPLSLLLCCMVLHLLRTIFAFLYTHIVLVCELPPLPIRIHHFHSQFLRKGSLRSCRSIFLLFTSTQRNKKDDRSTCTALLSHTRRSTRNKGIETPVTTATAAAAEQDDDGEEKTWNHKTSFSFLRRCFFYWLFFLRFSWSNVAYIFHLRLHLIHLLNAHRSSHLPSMQHVCLVFPFGDKHFILRWFF